MAFAIRRAIERDAEGIVAILEGIAAERIYTAIDRPWSADEQRRYLTSLSAREAVHVAETHNSTVISYQTLELWAPTIRSMAHVGQLGTFLKPEWRRSGIGEALFRATLEFAKERDFIKFVIQVRSTNTGAQSFISVWAFVNAGA